MYKVTGSASEQRLFESLDDAMGYYKSISFENLCGMLFKQVMRVKNVAPEGREPYFDNDGIVAEELVGDDWDE